MVCCDKLLRPGRLWACGTWWATFQTTREERGGATTFRLTTNWNCKCVDECNTSNILSFLFFYQKEVDKQYKKSFFFFRELTLCTAHQWSPFLSTSHISFAPLYVLLYFSSNSLFYHPVCIFEYVIIKWLLVIAWNWFHDIGTTMFFTSNKRWNHK